MFNLTPFKNQTNQVSSGNVFFDLFNQMENMMFNSFQSSFNTMNNTSFIDQGSEYIFTLTLPNLKRENIQLVVEDQLLILTVKQEYQATQDGAQVINLALFSNIHLGEVESNKITARLNQDTLTIIFPKKQLP